MTAAPTPRYGEREISAELHRRFCSDVPNDGTYTLNLNETETIRFFAELDRLEAEAVAQRVAEARKAWESESATNAHRSALEAVEYWKDQWNKQTAERDQLAALVVRLESKLHAINCAVDGYVDGAPDAGPVAKLANEVSLIINPPSYP